MTEQNSKQPNHVDVNARTNAVGLFNTARSYWQAGVHLNALNLKVTHPSAPTTFLLCHAIELYLKAYLRGHGHTVEELKKVGHRIPKLSAKAVALNLTLAPEFVELLSFIDDADTAIEARYIVTGFKSAPTIDSLIKLAGELDKFVGESLRGEGFPIRGDVFSSPRTMPEVDDAAEAEDYIQYMTAKDRQIVSYLIHRNQRMFTADSDGGHARLLLSKGIVRIAAKHGQHIDMSEVPFEIPKHIWEVLLRHRNEFPYEPEEDAPHPWRVHWMER